MTTRCLSRPLAPLLLAALLFAATPAAGEEIWMIAATEQRLTQVEARELILDGKYEMVKVEDGERVRALLYNDIDELAPWVSAERRAEMARPPEPLDPAAGWLGQPYPPFEFTDLEGRPVRTADLLGQVVVLNYWFIGCVPCKLETPYLNELVKHFAGEKVHFVAATFDPPEDIREHLEKNPFDYRQTSAELDHLQQLGVVSYPTHVVLGRDGRVHAYRTGVRGGLEKLRDDLDQAIRGALAGEEPPAPEEGPLKGKQTAPAEQPPR